MSDASPAIRRPYPSWMIHGMDALAVGIMVASFRDAHAIVSGFGQHDDSWVQWIVAAAVVVAMDLAIILLESVRAEQRLRGEPTLITGGWVIVLIVLSASLNTTYLADGVISWHQSTLAIALGMAIPLSLAVLGHARSSMLAFNARTEWSTHSAHEPNGQTEATHASKPRKSSRTRKTADRLTFE